MKDVRYNSTEGLVMRTLHRLHGEGAPYLSAASVAERANIARARCESALANLDFKELVVGYPVKSGGMIWRLSHSGAAAVDLEPLAIPLGPRFRVSPLALRVA